MGGWTDTWMRKRVAGPGEHSPWLRSESPVANEHVAGAGLQEVSEEGQAMSHPAQSQAGHDQGRQPNPPQ